MLREENRGAQVTNPAHQEPNPRPIDRIQAGARLVQHQDFGLQSQDGADGHQLLLPTGKVLRRARQKRLDSSRFRRPTYSLPHLPSAQAQAFQAVCHLPLHGTVEKLCVGILKYHPHVAKNLADGMVPSVHAAHQQPTNHVPGIEIWNRTVEHATKGGLSRSAGTHEQHVVTRFHRQIDHAQDVPSL